MSDQRRVKSKHGGLIWTPIRGFWQLPLTLDEADPEILNLPLVTPAGGSHNITGAGQLASAEDWGQPAILATVAAVGIATAEAWGQPSLVPVVAPVGIPSGETWGTPAILVTVGLVGVDTAEAWGLPTVSVPTGAHDIIDAGGLASDEAWGLPTLSDAVEEFVRKQWIIVETRRGRQPSAKEELDKLVEDIVAEAFAEVESTPEPAIKVAVRQLVSSGTSGYGTISNGEILEFDWRAFARESDKVRDLLRLWQDEVARGEAELDDEEVLLLS